LKRAIIICLSQFKMKFFKKEMIQVMMKNSNLCLANLLVSPSKKWEFLRIFSKGSKELTTQYFRI
jgi:hypothetical protein